MFTAALFAIAKTWKQPRYTLIDEWLKKMWHICMIWYSAIKMKTTKTKTDSQKQRPN